MSRRLVSAAWTIGLAVLAGLPARSIAAENPRRTPEPRPVGFALPEDAWEAYVTAARAEDGKAIYECLTPAARDEHVFESLLGAMMAIHYLKQFEKDRPEIRDLSNQFDKLLKKHGIDCKKTEEKANDDLDRRGLQKLLLGHMKQKKEFFVAVVLLMAKAQRAMAAVFSDISGEPSGDSGETKEAADAEKLTNVKIRGDRATALLKQRLPEGTVLERGGRRVRFVTETKYFRRIDGRWFCASEDNEPVDAPLHEVADVPYTKVFTMEAWDALRFRLPGGKVLAIWCHGGHAVLDDTSLALSWGEKPFQQLRCKRRRMPDGTTHLAEWDSYIRQGSVITSSRTPGRCRELFIDKYHIMLEEGQVTDGKMAVTMRVRLATKKELLFGDAEREHYLARLKSDMAAERLEAIKQLAEMAWMGSIYAGDPKEIAAAIRPLTDDPDAKVKVAAEATLRTIGDKQALLALITPEPQGPWRNMEGGRRIAEWNLKQKHKAVFRKVLSFFDSGDEDLVAFAVGFFARDEEPMASQPMLAALKHRSPAIRAEVVGSVRFFCEREEAATHLTRMLDDPSQDVLLETLRAANWLIQSMDATKITPFLKHGAPEIREMAVYALDRCRDPKAVGPLLEATKDANPRVRGRAAVTLARTAAPRAFDRLLEMLGDKEACVRVEALNALRRFDDPRAIPHIEKLLDTEKDNDVRGLAERTAEGLKR